MSIVDSMQGLLKHLQQVRETQGEEAWRQENIKFVKASLRHPKTKVFAEAYAKELGLDIEQLRAEVEAEEHATSEPPQGDVFLNALQSQMPSIKSQAQLNAFILSFDALRVTLNAIFSGDSPTETQGRQALEKGFELAHVVSRCQQQLQDVPEAAKSKVAEEFLTPPAQFHEYDLQKSLLMDVQACGSLEVLNDWYATNREKIDRVKSQSLRNTLFDAIRSKRESFGK